MTTKRLRDSKDKRRGTKTLLFAITFSCMHSMAQAQMMVPPSSTDGSTVNTQDDSTQTITSTTTNPPAGLPVVVSVSNGYNLNVTTLTGLVSVDGIPTPDPVLNAAVVYQSAGTTPIDAKSPAGKPGGNVTVQANATITATGVIGSAAGPGGLLAISLGANGFDNGGQELPQATDYNVEAFYGTAGGEINLTLSGTISVTGAGSGSPTSFLTPTLTGMSAISIGGNDTSGYYDSGGVEHTPVTFVGDGATTGVVEVTTSEHSSIEVTQSGDGTNAVGIYAAARGGNAGKFVQSPTLEVGAGATPNAISVYHAGSITVNADVGFGILATSTGGNGNDSDIPPTNEGGGRPGNGGGVTVETAGAQVRMPLGGIGIFALSQAGNWNPWSDSYLPSGGAVDVMVNGGIIEVGSGSNPFSFGILAVSAGNPLITGKDFLDNLTGSGVAGNVTVTNGGSISTNGELAIGIVALGIGGTPAIGTATSGLGTLGNSGTITGAGGSDVSVLNTGSIMTLGLSANGIVAISSGGGGILKNDAPATTSGGAWISGISVGANTDSGTPVTDGGTVTIINAGSITTGDGLGNGTASLGIIAQSIGGSGGTVGGVESLRSVGDTEGGGGSAGTVNVTLNQGSAITTWDKNSNAVLVQSIGGGGGNGANASGGFAAVGGAGGAGGSGNVASFSTSGTGSINTYGNYSAGAVIQSIGGGGGTGGFADSDGAFISNAIGGTAGGGGDGGVATGTNNVQSSLATRGNQSAGMIIQSIGGGGGVGGAANSFSAGFIFSVSNAVGGTGGNGGSGQSATGMNLGTIVTGLAPNSFSNSTLVNNTGVLYGTLPDGTYLGSIPIESGSLSSGVFSGTLGDVTLANGNVMENATINGMTISGTVNGTPTTLTLQWGGIVGAQVANASSDLLNGLFVNGKVITDLGGPNPNGADSAGMIVQSIGGGGGLGGSATAKSLVLPLPSPGLDVHPPTIAYAVAVGGTGGLGGDGGNVIAGNSNAITTYGDGSYGMVAQSIGGGGGIGGDATAGTKAIEGQGATLMVSLGGAGSGGAGGSGGTVTAYSGASSGSGSGHLFTFGQNAAGIVAQSIGGGGGLGGSGNAGTSAPYLHNPTGNAVAISQAVGGGAGAAGDGGSVIVNNAEGSVIATFGSASQGIVAQSIGGGGGAGGGGSSSGSDDTLSIDVSVGGAGTDGGQGGSVTVENDGTIFTSGGDSIGILAQSIGGGGGAGGTSDAGATATLSVVDQLNDFTQIIQKWVTMAGGSYGAELSVGGNGGAGGDGDSVVVSNRGGSTLGSGNPKDWTPGILTAGSRAHGVLAQSIGGGGGTGGTATSSSRSATNVFGVNPNPATQQYTASLKIGGDNGAGGDGSYVTVTNYGVIGTLGYGASAMVLQGIGGGGGNGADGSVDTDVDISLGRTGSASGLDTHVGGGLTANNDSNAGLFTLGRDATAILAQSIGGGGGLAGTGVDEFETLGNGLAGTVKHTLSLGQNVSTLYNEMGGVVTVNDQGAVRTYGDWSHGIVAQSIGAGGGKAGVYATDSVTPELAITLGAEGGNGDGGTVNVNLLPDSWIVTGGTASGYSAYGVLAQSIGGGGGLAADLSDWSTAASGTIQLGNQGAGNGGAVTLSGTSHVTTYGDAAHAIVLQSIGGGGGVAGSGSTLTAESPALTGGVEVNVSGGSGADGNGGTVSIANAMLNVATSGENAYGVLAQSIGGGGGLGFAQNAAGGAIINSNLVMPMPFVGGTVSLLFAEGSQIVTQGNGAHAIVAQAIGGGGGIANYSSGTPGLTVESGGSSNGSGDGGVVQITTNGTIYTSGAGAYGILAQSIGGGGGLIGGDGALYAGTTGSPNQPSWGGMVEILQYGTITTSGVNSIGIFAQSKGTWFADEIYITVNGSVYGGSGDQGYGIWVDGGNYSNQVIIEPGGSISAASGRAINYTGNGALDVMNFGEVAGSVSVGSGTFYNEGTYSPGSTAATQSASLFATATFASSPPAANPVNINGNYVQTRKGTLLLNFTSTKNRDYFHASGSAHFEGKLRLNLPRGFTADVIGSHTLLEADGGLTTRFSRLESSLPSLSLRIKGSDLVVKQNFTDLPGARYTHNQKAMAQYLDQLANYRLKGNFLDLLTELHNLSTAPEAVADAFSQLSPEAFSQFVRTTSFNNATFFAQQLGSYTRRAHSVASSHDGLDVSGLNIRDSSTPSLLTQVENRLTGWNPLPIAENRLQRPDALPVQRWNTFLQGNVILAQGISQPGISHADSTTGAIQLGSDYRLTPDLIVGAYLGYDHTEATLDTRGSYGKMETYRTGLYSAYASNGWYANGLAGWGWKSLTFDRRLSFGNYSGVAHGEPNGSEWLANIEAGYDFRAGGWSFGPAVGLQFTRFTVDPYTETGAPGADLSVDDQDGESLRSRLGGRASYTFQRDAFAITPHLDVSWQHDFLDESEAVTSQFSSTGKGSFTVQTPQPSRDSILIGVGVAAEFNRRVTVFADYWAQAGQADYFGQTFMSGMKIRF